MRRFAAALVLAEFCQYSLKIVVVMYNNGVAGVFYNKGIKKKSHFFHTVEKLTGARHQSALMFSEAVPGFC